MKARNYRDLIAWQRAMDLVERVYESTRGFPEEELYGLTAQVRRAAISVPSNIAEGQGRRSAREFARYLAIAHGSLREVETHVLVSSRLVLLRTDRAEQLLELTGEVGRLITGLANTVCRQIAVGGRQ